MEFDNLKWRKIIKLAQQDVCHIWDKISVISPFGFEMTQNKAHLKKTLRRFYCYLGVPLKHKNSLEEITNKFSERLLYHLKLLDINFFNHIVIVIKNKKLEKLKENHYLCRQNDKLIDIQARTTDDIMLDYTDAILASLNGLLQGKGESSLFHSNAVKRSRVFQLYFMFEHLFAVLIQPLSKEQKLMYAKIIPRVNNSIQVFFTPILMNTVSTHTDQSILKKLIVPRLALILEAINQSDTKKYINSLDYHVDEKIDITLDLSVYQETITKFKKMYDAFI